ncbi:O-antigen ABC transporter, permease protein, partial [mine drainage metagenome]
MNWQTLWSYRHLVANLVRKDIRVRYMGAALGFAWSLANPLVITIMYLLVFTYVFPSNQPDYPLFMVTGMIHWTLFSQVTVQSSDLLVANSGLVKKIYFPRLLVPTANLLTNLTLWIGAFAIYLTLFAMVLGGHFAVIQLLYPLYLALFLVVVWGLSLFLCTLFVHF